MIQVSYPLSAPTAGLLTVNLRRARSTPKRKLKISIGLAPLYSCLANAFPTPAVERTHEKSKDKSTKQTRPR